MPYNRDFRVLLVQLSEKLDKHNIESIMAIEDLPRRLKDQSGLEILLQLENEEKISASNPTSLEELLKTIGRKDLAKRVGKLYKKKGKKAERTADYKEIHQSLEANLEVTLVQMRLLKEQLEHLKEKLEQSGLKNAQDALQMATLGAENVVEPNLLEVKRIIKTRSIDSSGSEDSLPIPLAENYCLKGYLPKNATPPSPFMLPPQTLSTLGEGEYEDAVYTEVHHHLLPQSIAATNRSHAQAQSTQYQNLPMLSAKTLGEMVTGASDDKMRPSKPIPLPKPTQLSKPAPLPKPKNYKKRSTEPVYAETGEDYTGGTGGTGSTTGDSGFSDAKQFLKSPLSSASSLLLSPPPPPPHHQYTPINRKEVASPYYKSTRENCDKFQDLMKSQAKETEIIYMNNSTAPHDQQ